MRKIFKILPLDSYQELFNPLKHRYSNAKNPVSLSWHNEKSVFPARETGVHRTLTIVNQQVLNLVLSFSLDCWQQKTATIGCSNLSNIIKFRNDLDKAEKLILRPFHP